MVTATITDGQIRRLRLFQLLSPSLPVGAFAYSQGLEWAAETGWVNSEQALANWLSDQLSQALTYVDLPVLLRMIEAAMADDAQWMSHWISELQALRETAELRAEETGRGRALADLLGSLGLLDEPGTYWRTLLSGSQLSGFAFAAAAWQIESTDALLGYAWSWAENLTLAGVKLIPLGQTAGQRVLLRLAEQIPAAVEAAQRLDDADIGASTPALAIASSRHETQYTRLYRS
ncbi:urease accessory protein UreF [Halochromatium roseum]|nr:urease accessory protein UreF [Halochromatium roseum]